jgi:flagellar biosynthesis anti-sigma factor FlgM
MRIDLYNSTASEIASENNAKQVGGASAEGTAPAGAEDRATLTSDSATVGSLVSKALNSPEIRQGNVDQLRAAVSSGKYELDPGKIAASIIDEQG